ncbi:phage adaptor protein [Ensifer adhaerens]|uniref:phage adaptor protein n=1 Tax=Ensifer adhaerens TaxID=106592 RepID=UPI003D052D25
MALGNYHDLQTAIVDFAPELSVGDPITSFIALAESDFFPQIEHYMCERTVSLTSAGNAVTLPADFTKARVIRVDGKIAKPVSVYGATLAHGEIGYFQSGNTYAFVPNQADPRAVELTYFAVPPALSDANLTNWVLTQFPAIYLYGSLAQGFYWRGNEAAEAQAKAKMNEALAKLLAHSARGTSSGNQIVEYGGNPYGD